MNENAETFSSAELVIFECEAENGPFEQLPEVAAPKCPVETIRLVGRLASQNLPDDQRTLIRMMLDGKPKDEIAKTLHIAFPQLYYLWRDAYRHTKNALDIMPEIDADLRRFILVKITHFSDSN